jgi:hypothetical protein
MLVVMSASAAHGQTTAFTYQGQLSEGGMLASGNYDVRFALFDSAAGGAQISANQTVPTVPVSDGVFTVQLDFGVDAFPGANRFVEIGVKPAGGGSFTTLAPRQQISSSPYAIRTLSAATADALSSACVGCVKDTQIQAVAGSKVTGAIPAASLPSGSGNYIQNTTAQQASSNFNISGNGVVGGDLTVAGMLNANVSGNFIQNGTTPQAGANFNVGGNGTAGGTLSGNTVNAATQYNIGSNRVLSVAGTQNVFAGGGAGQANTAGCSNAFFGTSAGLNNTDGYDNSFVGDNAGQGNVDGSTNSFFGTSAGFSNTSGRDNSFFGEGAGYFTTHGANSFFGTTAGFSNTTGGANSFFGRGAGYLNTTGSNNTLIGDSASAASNNLNFATAIGANAVVSTSNTIVLGRSTDKVVASGRMQVSSIPLLPSAAAVCFNQAGDLLQCGASSLRLKTNVHPFLDGLDIVRRLRPISFNWKKGGAKDIGLGAEDVAKVAPSLTLINGKGEAEGVKYERLNIVLINAIKEQQEQIVRQQLQIEQLQHMQAADAHHKR